VGPCNCTFSFTRVHKHHDARYKARKTFCRKSLKASVCFNNFFCSFSHTGVTFAVECILRFSGHGEQSGMGGTNGISTNRRPFCMTSEVSKIHSRMINRKAFTTNVYGMLSLCSSQPDIDRIVNSFCKELDASAADIKAVLFKSFF